MLKIRLTRMGRKNRPFYRIVVIESTKSPKGRFVESLGSFDPRDKEKTLTLSEDRIKYWLSEGAKASPVVFNILVDKGIVTGSKMQATRTHKKKDQEGDKEKAAKPAESSKDQEDVKPKETAPEKPAEEKV